MKKQNLHHPGGFGYVYWMRWGWRSGQRPDSGTIHYGGKWAQYVSVAYAQQLKKAGLLASTGSTGDSYDNLMAESTNDLYKVEVIYTTRTGKNVQELK